MAEYRKVLGWPYSVSDDGKIRSDRTGHILKPAVSNAGYLRVHFCVNGNGKNASIHRLVAEAFVPNPNMKPEVNHIDGNKLNNRAENLEWVTGAENKKHCREVLGKINKNPDLTAAHTARKKRVRCIDTGEEFESITIAAKSVGVTTQSLSAHLIGDNHSCRGMRFEYV